MNPQNVVGSVTGTGAAINVEIGFLPDRVELVNQTTGRKVTWYRTMAAGSGVADGATAAALIAAGGGGVSPFSGSTTAGLGFTIGTDAVNTAGQVIAYSAIRSGPGAK